MILTRLRPYQKEAVAAALQHDGFLLIPEQRTGKCLMALSVVDHRKPKHLVIVCPIGAIREWNQQIDDHLKADWECHLTILNYEELSRNKKRRRAYYKWASSLGRKNCMLIVDEAHMIKKRGSGQSQAVRTFSRRFKYRLALTGTPIAQGIQDGWALMDFADKRVFGIWEVFAARHLEMGGFKGKKVVSHRNVEEFNEKFHSRSYRITLREAKREGGKRHIVRHRRIVFDLNPDILQLYQVLEEQLRLEVNRVKIKIKSMMTAVIKLQQLTGGSVIETSEFGSERRVHDVSNEKILALNQLWKAELQGKKFVVVCRFVHEIERVKRLFLRRGLTVKIVKGGMPFDGKFEEDVLVLQIQSGIAVDMSEADAMVFYSINYSYINYDQSRFRILSFNKESAAYYYLLARDTIDEDIYRAVTDKKQLADVVCDHYRRQSHRGEARAFTRPSERRLVERAVRDAIQTFIS